MNTYNMFFNNTFVKSTAIEFNCPSCGQKCNNKDELCSLCSYNLKEYKSNLLIAYSYFNEAVREAKAKNYFESIINISKFLAFYPDDIDANKFYIYLLHKNGSEDLFKKAISEFEKNFIRNSWIMEIETKGIDSYKIPDAKCEGVKGNKNAFTDFICEYVSFRAKNTKHIIELINEFYEVFRVYKERKDGVELVKFYETSFLQFLSKKEIKIEIHDGMILDELPTEEIKSFDILTKIKDKKKKQGSLITYYPAIYLRHALVSKEKVVFIDNAMQEKKSKNEPVYSQKKDKNKKHRRG
jgi:hypothetical protein